MISGFKDFLAAYRKRQLVRDAAWRAYDIEAGFSPLYVKRAMTALGYQASNRLDLGQLRVDYDIQPSEDIELILSSWWLWKSASEGIRLRGLRERKKDNA